MEVLKKICLLVLTSVCLYSCYKHNAETTFPKGAVPGGAGCDTTNVSYDSTVKNIFLQNCALTGCHASGSATGGYTLDNYTGVKSIILSGRIIGAITHQSGYVPMPKDRMMLTECQIGLIVSWIHQGAQNN
jgi:hypothetical protein